MKRTLLIVMALFPLLGIYGLYAQKEFWGTTHGQQNTPFFGTIYKTDANGENPVRIHSFDSLKGKQPDAPLFLASNGKLYGTTTRGGYYFNPDFSGGILYEYDLILDKFRVVNYFGDATNPNLREPLYSGVIEPTANTLIGAINYNGTYKYNMVNEATSVGAIVPSFTSQNLIIRNELTGELTKASNGFIYGTTRHFSSVPNAAPYIGAIAKINPATNAFLIVHPLNSIVSMEGWGTTGSLVEALPNKLYGTTPLGGVNFEPEHQTYGGGVLFEFDITTNTFTKKIDFDYYTTGSGPFPLTLAANGKVYGFTSDGSGINPIDGSSYKGALFEYDPSNNTVNIRYHFTDQPVIKLLAASDGNLYGTNASGIFKFDLITNTLTQACVFDYETFGSYGISSSLIEICRKPRYHFFDTDTFDACAGETFTYDIQNTNATTYQWTKGNTNVPGQTTGILNLANLTAADAGDYTCVMTNECGSTTTMPLHLTVNCLGVNTIANLEQAVSSTLTRQAIGLISNCRKI